MKEILFRGKNDGDWVFGSLVYSKKEEAYYICEHEAEELSFMVYNKTVGQFIGMTDKNGKKIFEGDIVRFSHPAYPVMVGKVGYEEQELSFTMPTKYTFDAFGYMADMYEVIGNIHDNPELLEGEE